MATSERSFQLDILGIEYSVSFTGDICVTSPDHSSGYCNISNKTIEVPIQKTRATQRETLLHEILEAIVHELELDIPHHRVISALGVALQQVLSANKDIMRAELFGEEEG